MKLSKEHKLMIAEAVASIAIGCIDSMAGTISTVASVALHLQFDRQSRQSCPYAQIIKGNKVQQRFPHCQECPSLKMLNLKKDNEETPD
jgi:hypothetical protein